MVSHDRDFLSGLCEKIFEFKDKKIKTYIGDVFDFLEKKKLDTLNELQRKLNIGVGEERQISANKENYLIKKEQEAQQRKIQNQLKKIETEIENEQKKLHLIEMKLALPEQYAKEIADGSLYAEYEKWKNSIAEKEEKWLELQG